MTRDTKSPAESFGVVVFDMSHYADPDHQIYVSGFPTLEDAIAYCRRRTRDSLEQLRTPGQTSDELRELWWSFGEDVVVVEGSRYCGSADLDLFIDNPASPDERDWVILERRLGGALHKSRTNAAFGPVLKFTNWQEAMVEFLREFVREKGVVWNPSASNAALFPWDDPAQSGGETVLPAGRDAIASRWITIQWAKGRVRLEERDQRAGAQPEHLYVHVPPAWLAAFKAVPWPEYKPGHYTRAR